MTRIALVVSDVDGTLLTKDKILTDGAKAAVRQLHDAGIGFTIISSRPTIGMGFLIEPLAITLPIGAFNGSSIVDPAVEADRAASDPAAVARAQHRRAPRIRRRYLAVHQRPMADAQSATANMSRTKSARSSTIRPSSRISRPISPPPARSSAPAPMRRCCNAARPRCRRLSARGHRGPIADLLSRRHAARPRQGHLRRDDGQTAGHFHRRGRHHRRHAERSGDVSPERHLDRDGQRHR